MHYQHHRTLLPQHVPLVGYVHKVLYDLTIHCVYFQSTLSGMSVAQWQRLSAVLMDASSSSNALVHECRKAQLKGIDNVSTCYSFYKLSMLKIHRFYPIYVGKYIKQVKQSKTVQPNLFVFQMRFHPQETKLPLLLHLRTFLILEKWLRTQVMQHTRRREAPAAGCYWNFHEIKIIEICIQEPTLLCNVLRVGV